MSDTRPFQLLIKPVGADCNLRCDYCFYLRAQELYAERGRHIMSDEVLERMVSGLMQLRFPQSVFAWQGGEPTLAGVDFFRRVVAFQQRYGISGQFVSNSLQTNGILLDEEWCRLFREYHFLVGLSMDGPQHIHDSVRKTGDGRGTWEKVRQSAHLMDQHNVEYNILCVVNAANIRMGADLLRWFVDNGFSYVQFIPCLEPGLEHNVDADAYGDFLCSTFDYWSKDGFGKVSVRDFDSILSARMGVPGVMCTYGRRCNHYIVIEHTGDVYPCDFYVYDEWKLGNLMDAPIESFMQHDLYRQFAGQKNKVPACRGCTWRKMCYGGCQKDRRIVGDVTQPSPLCPAYKKFFAHATPRLNALAKRLANRSPAPPPV
ncbi:MAG: anaerobic sulfatase maturase [Nitrospiraceae bacterium]|nr:anaerobic sulfatase maturase [Nitrospiraceae bacterium]